MAKGSKTRVVLAIISAIPAIVAVYKAVKEMQTERGRS
ncbi:hypothetical protein RU97_GL000070 [Enterococcus canis]|uniref:Uncharacterized protein n=1 Tax=Enterococcus canis TaxID=214095 RepID=A0A1L8RJ96_9ENTE|nr:hypothetical protein RU97_GL000070 [Enterococcus canis]